MGNHDVMASIIAEQRPAWRPGSRHGYHTLTLGWYQNELIRRVDPQHRSIGRFFQEEIARPLGVEFYIGLPAGIAEDDSPGSRAFIDSPFWGTLPSCLLAWCSQIFGHGRWWHDPIGNPQFDNPAEFGGPEYRAVEIPSANGIGQARAIAKVYSLLAGDGRELASRLGRSRN